MLRRAENGISWTYFFQGLTDTDKVVRWVRSEIHISIVAAPGIRQVTAGQPQTFYMPGERGCRHNDHGIQLLVGS